jgi:serine/threonine-protein kinase
MKEASNIVKEVESATFRPVHAHSATAVTMRSPGQGGPDDHVDPSAPRPLRAGDVLAGHYRLERKVGTGGMGEVWAAEHLTIHMRVAVKVLLDRARRDPDIRARFEREAVLLGRTHGCHVARVIDFASDPVYGPVLVTEFVEGASLAEVLKTPLDVEHAIELAIDLAAGLAELHRARVVHRDLKPANVILRATEEGGLQAVLIDLGVSHTVEGEPGGGADLSPLTGSDVVVGTLEYMPPEQILCSAKVTPAADIYAFGALLVRAVTGRNVFGPDLDRVDLVHAKLTRDAPPLETGRQDPLALGLAAIVRRTLERSPSKRYASADELRAALCHLRDAHDHECDAVPADPPSREPAEGKSGVTSAASAAVQLAREVSRRVLAMMA